MIETTGNDLVVIADNPQEMVEAQNVTIAKIKEKLAAARNEAADAIETVKCLSDAGMATSAADRIVKRADSRVDFLDKVVQALEAGYLIVPEMPANVVAIRVNRPPRGELKAVDGDWTPRINERAAPGLPAGEGQYVDPMPPTEMTRHTLAGQEKIHHTNRYTTGEWNTEIALPAEFLRPTVVQRTGMMMMRKIFDEVAVIGAGRAFGDTRLKADPMVVGSVIDRVAKRKVWFLIAWFVDTKQI